MKNHFSNIPNAASNIKGHFNVNCTYSPNSFRTAIDSPYLYDVLRLPPQQLVSVHRRCKPALDFV